MEDADTAELGREFVRMEIITDQFRTVKLIRMPSIKKKSLFSIMCMVESGEVTNIDNHIK